MRAIAFDRIARAAPRVPRAPGAAGAASRTAVYGLPPRDFACAIETHTNGGQATWKPIHLPTTGPVQVGLHPAQNSIGALAQNSFGADTYAYLRYKLSLCDLVEMMAERGLSLVGTMNSCAG